MGTRAAVETGTGTGRKRGERGKRARIICSIMVVKDVKEKVTPTTYPTTSAARSDARVITPSLKKNPIPWAKRDE